MKAKPSQSIMKKFFFFVGTTVHKGKAFTKDEKACFVCRKLQKIKIVKLLNKIQMKIFQRNIFLNFQWYNFDCQLKAGHSHCC